MFYTTVLPSAFVALFATLFYRMVLDRISISSKPTYDGYLALAGRNLQFGYKVHPLIFNRTCSFSHANIGLILQGSLNNFKYLPKTISRWAGPIDLVIYSNTASSQTVHDTFYAIVALRNCIPAFQCQVNVHAVFGADLNLTNDLLAAEMVWKKRPIAWSCDKLDQLLNNGLVSLPNMNNNYSPSIMPYPVNLLRKVGREQSHFAYHLVLDMDIIPSYKLFELSDDLLKRIPFESLKNVALVLSAFETDIPCVGSATDLPQTKDQLLLAVEHGKIRPFYSNVNIRVQQQTNYPKWYRLELDLSDQMSIAYWTDWQFTYEPFIIVHSSAPNYDPRFVQYGVNRLSNICHLHMAGYNFAVLDKPFLIHCGLKKNDGFHKSKAGELAANQEFYQKNFITELFSLYPDNGRSC